MGNDNNNCKLDNESEITWNCAIMITLQAVQACKSILNLQWLNEIKLKYPNNDKLIGNPNNDTYR